MTFKTRRRFVVSIRCKYVVDDKCVSASESGRVTVTVAYLPRMVSAAFLRDWTITRLHYEYMVTVEQRMSCPFEKCVKSGFIFTWSLSLKTFSKHSWKTLAATYGIWYTYELPKCLLVPALVEVNFLDALGTGCGCLAAAAAAADGFLGTRSSSLVLRRQH